jgi:16S rRNA (guanine527-N7)-methyltransferase
VTAEGVNRRSARQAGDRRKLGNGVRATLLYFTDMDEEHNIAMSYDSLSQEAIRTALMPYGVEFTADLCSSIRTYASLLKYWNERISLTSVRGSDAILRLHFGESFYAKKFVDFRKSRLADVGSGAGFPGLALKLLCPDLQLTLIESNAKKATFLAEVVRTLNLKDVEVFRGRAEAWVPDGRYFGFVTARAVGNFPDLLDWSHSYLSPGGKAVLWVGSDAMPYLHADKRWSWQEPKLIPGSQQRYVVVGSLL